ncbi:hypothetical protein BB560_005807 [Smittium megazygosporum]|uniref:CBM21 domain-containing protein n=1 Tax=Smittium megazygosporum TaxID=133381 RepID=A0A2T9YVQ7_9FUNG|nr:hypothetical protein BB560_005807 [Smittium megazygosporum]
MYFRQSQNLENSLSNKLNRISPELTIDALAHNYQFPALTKNHSSLSLDRPELVSQLSPFSLSTSRNKLSKSKSDISLYKKSCIKQTNISHKKKRVSFGQTVESVRFFLKSEPPLKCQEDSYPMFSFNEPEKYSSRFIDCKNDGNVPYVNLKEVNGPAKLYIFNDSREVYLTKALFDRKRNAIFGNIHVKNLGYEKHVFIKYTFDLWDSMDELEAEFKSTISNCCDNREGIDSFSFSLKVPERAKPRLLNNQALSLEFCIRYCVNGSEYWDNNCGKNYIYDLEYVDPRREPKSHSNKTSQEAGLCRAFEDISILQSIRTTDYHKNMFLNAPKKLEFASFKQDASFCFGSSVYPSPSAKKSGISNLLKNEQQTTENRMIDHIGLLSTSPSSIMSKQTALNSSGDVNFWAVQTSSKQAFAPNGYIPSCFPNSTSPSQGRLVIPKSARQTNALPSNGSRVDNPLLSSNDSVFASYGYGMYSSSPLNDSLSLIY